jgi:Type II restriction endonuclease EcoO109I
MSDFAQIAAAVRQTSGVPAGVGPRDQWIAAAVQGFVEVFDYWYIRVMRQAVPKYRTVVIQRINPIIRRIQYEGLDCAPFAIRIVEDYNSRNFVTAGGWAIEELPARLNQAFQKSAAKGIDLQRSDPATNEHHLYVIKSGMVTRNSDIVAALKRHSRDAEKLLRQSSPKVRVTANYIVAAGKTTSTFEDGVRRPSSAEFWAEVTGLSEELAIEFVLAVAMEAGRLVKSDASEHVQALRTLVEAYIADPSDPLRVDWSFLKARLFRKKSEWVAEDKRRHLKALEALKATGYGQVSQVAEESAAEEAKPEDAMEDDDLPKEETDTDDGD